MARGYSLVEVLVVVGITAVACVVTVPSVIQALDAADAAAAARYLSALVARARIDAVRRQASVAVRFDLSTDDPTFTVVVDGDGDGVNAADIAAGIDRVVQTADRVSWHFSRVRLGVGRASPGIEGGEALAAGADPVRLGTARQLTFTPLGTATSGTIYLSSAGGRQLAVRVGGVTGRARVLRLSPGGESWQPL